MSLRAKRLGAGLYYVAVVVVIVGVALGGHVYRWEVIVWLVTMSAVIATYQWAIRLYKRTVALQECTINGQQEIIKDAIAELSRRNAGLN